MPTIMRWILVLCSAIGLSALLAWWLIPAPTPPVRSTVALPPLPIPTVPLPPGTDPTSIALRGALLNGERVYQRLCFHCHGRQGKGDNNAYMASRGHKPADHTDLAAMQRLSDGAFFLALRDGVQDQRGWFTMPPWASVLTPQEMWDVIAYVRHLPLAMGRGGADE